MQKNSSVLIICLMLVTGFCACKSPNKIKELTNHDLTIQLKKIADGNDITAVNYAARIIPGKKLLSAKGDSSKTALWYKMDSCFYIQDGNKKTYASMVQPIANGVAGSFEYFLTFEIPGAAIDKGSFIYQDKYLNHIKYSISLGKRITSIYE